MGEDRTEQKGKEMKVKAIDGFDETIYNDVHSISASMMDGFTFELSFSGDRNDEHLQCDRIVVIRDW